MAKKRRKDFRFEIEVPSEIQASLDNGFVTLKKDSKEIKRVIDKEIIASQEGKKIILEVKKAGKLEKRRFGTMKSHVKNMIEGLMHGHEYELEICIVHFPMTVTFDKAKSEFTIKNLLGEKSPRTIKAFGNVEVEIKAPHIKIKSYDLEAAGQTAANLEKITKIRNRDRNKFQDGIFITKKPEKVVV